MAMTGAICNLSTVIAKVGSGILRLDIVFFITWMDVVDLAESRARLQARLTGNFLVRIKSCGILGY